MKIETICPAKVNLFLAVGPPDVSGMHPLRTVFQAISLADRLVIEDSPTGQDELICNWPGMPENNTLTKTLRLLRELVPVPRLRMTLTKSIPAESGMGGGSSNAAGLLRCLQAINPGWIPDFVAHSVAAAVGADVPFFLTGGCARGEGYGEQITALPDGEPRWLVVIRPNEGVSTPAAYRALDAMDREWRAYPPDPWTALFNDFERVAPCMCGEIAERLQVHGAEGALLSGSGSAVFGWFSSEAEAAQALGALQNENLGDLWLARTLTREESLWTTW